MEGCCASRRNRSAQIVKPIALRGNLGEMKPRKGPSPIGFAIRFWNKVNRRSSSDCWNWIGSLNTKTGYGQIGVGSDSNGTRAMRLAHRISWLIHFGEVPEKKQVLHKCDNRKCVNPNHLYLGTHKDNMQDAYNRMTMIRGERHHNAKLTKEKVIELRNRYADGESIRSLSRSFKLDRATVKASATRKTWRQVL